MFVSGRADNPRTSELRAYRRKAGNWVRDASLAETIDPDQIISGGSVKVSEQSSHRAPCIGFTDAEHDPSIECKRGGVWTDLVQRSKLASFGTLADVRTAGSGLLILLRRSAKSSQVNRVIKLRPSGRMITLGEPFRTPRSIVFLSLAGRPTVLVQEQAGADRYVLGLSGGRWRRLTSTLHRSDGPLVGGAAVLGRQHQIIPVVETDHSPWTFSAFSENRRRGWKGERLSRGTGDAQGNLSQPGRAAWAIWQENAYENRRFDTRIRLSRYMRRTHAFSKPAAIFRGLSSGPGDLQVARCDGTSYVLYLKPRNPGGRSLRAFVRSVRMSKP
jgi:hypothetical protein